jgi:hypothetical protein
MDHIISHLFRAGTGPSTGLNHAPQAAQQSQKLSISPNFFCVDASTVGDRNPRLDLSIMFLEKPNQACGSHDT